MLTAKCSSPGGGRGRWEKEATEDRPKKHMHLNLEKRPKECVRIGLGLLKVCQVGEGFYQKSGQLEPTGERVQEAAVPR